MLLIVYWLWMGLILMLVTLLVILLYLKRRNMVMLMVCYAFYLTLVVKSLLEHGADVSLSNDFLQTPLHIACQENKQDCMDLLIRGGADINAMDGQGNTPLHVCILYSRDTCARKLLSNSNINLSLRNRKDELVSHCAYQNDNVYDSLKDHVTKKCIRQLLPESISTWSVTHVSEWLDIIGLPQYQTTFVSNDVTGRFLLSLAEHQLKEDLQVHSLGHRQHIVHEIIRAHSICQDKMPSSPQQNRHTSSEELDLNRSFISPEQVQLGEVIGRGFFGEVRKGKYAHITVAAKYLYRSVSQGEITKFINEIELLSTLRHPRIVPYLGWTNNHPVVKDSIVLITQYLSQGTLYNFIL